MDGLLLDRAPDPDGGYSLLQLLNKANAITPFRLTWFRAGHAHAGVLLLMSLLYTFMDKTSLAPGVKHTGFATVVVGILAQSGGFFIHIVKGQPDRASIGDYGHHDWRDTADLRYRLIGV